MWVAHNGHVGWTLNGDDGFYTLGKWGGDKSKTSLRANPGEGKDQDKTDCGRWEWMSVFHLDSSLRWWKMVVEGGRDGRWLQLEAFSSVQFSHSVVSDSLRPYESQHARPPCPSPVPEVYSNSCPSSWWCHPNISSSVVPFSSCPQSLPAPGSFPMSQFFTWGGQSTGVSASASVLPMNTQDWSPSGGTGWISLQSKGLSRVFSNTTVQKHQFFSTQLSSQSNSHIHTWPLEKP